MGFEKLAYSLGKSGLKFATKSLGKKGNAVIIQGKNGKQIIKLFDKSGEKLVKTKVSFSDKSTYLYEHTSHKNPVRTIIDSNGNKERCILGRSTEEGSSMNSWFLSPNKYSDALFRHFDVLYRNPKLVGGVLLGGIGACSGMIALMADHDFNNGKCTKAILKAFSGSENSEAHENSPKTENENDTGGNKKAEEEKKTEADKKVESNNKAEDENKTEADKKVESNNKAEDENKTENEKEPESNKKPKIDKKTEVKNKEKESEFEVKKAVLGDTYWGYAKKELIEEHQGENGYRPTNKAIVERMNKIMKRNGVRFADDMIHTDPILKVGDNVKLLKTA